MTDIVERLREWMSIDDSMGSRDLRLWREAASEIERLRNLYHAVHAMMIVLGYHGNISANDDRVSAVMESMHDIDAALEKAKC